MRSRFIGLWVAGFCMTGAIQASTDSLQPGDGIQPAALLARSVPDVALRTLMEETLARHPGLQAATATYRAARLEAPQARALPDPSAEVVAFPMSPETRVGPQKLMLGVTQPLPWSGKRDLRESLALRAALALEEEVDAERVLVVTEVRRLYYELLFLDRLGQITRTFREHLLQHEQIAQARYATGVGPAQAVIKLQAEITRVDRELLELDSRGVELSARLNRLRDRPAASPIERGALPVDLEEPVIDERMLVDQARVRRRELHAAEARIEHARALEELARKAYKPDFVVGLTYTLVDPREDALGRQSPPAGNGDDILGIRGGIRIPLWRASREADVEQAVERQLAATSNKRDLMLAIESDIADLSRRLPLAWRQLRLVEDLLVVQAEESLQSAEAGYIAGTLDALDLLDAEHILFEAKTAAARAKTDYLVGFARLEGAVGEPLAALEYE